MNHHADKVVTPVTDQEHAHADETFDGVVKQAYLCPSCGHDEFRVALPLPNRSSREPGAQ
jgi:hypothetical protein